MYWHLVCIIIREFVFDLVFNHSYCYHFNPLDQLLRFLLSFFCGQLPCLNVWQFFTVTLCHLIRQFHTFPFSFFIFSEYHSLHYLLQWVPKLKCAEIWHATVLILLQVQATVQQVLNIINQCLAVHEKLEASLRDLSRTGDVQSCKTLRRTADAQLKELVKELKPSTAFLHHSPQASHILPKVITFILFVNMQCGIFLLV